MRRRPAWNDKQFAAYFKARGGAIKSCPSLSLFFTLFAIWLVKILSNLTGSRCRILTLASLCFIKHYATVCDTTTSRHKWPLRTVRCNPVDTARSAWWLTVRNFFWECTVVWHTQASWPAVPYERRATFCTKAVSMLLGVHTGYIKAYAAWSSERVVHCRARHRRPSNDGNNKTFRTLSVINRLRGVIRHLPFRPTTEKRTAKPRHDRSIDD